MDTKKIGSLDVSVIGVGCNQFGIRLDQDRTSVVISAALDAGITFFDTADAYGGTNSEVFVANAIGGRRSEVAIATKFGMDLGDGKHGASPAYVKQACEASLARLNTDYIDLYQLHRPDPTVPISETLGAMNELIDAGKVREIGCSNFSLAQLQEARDAVAPGQKGFVSVQNSYNLLSREAKKDVIPECEAEGIAFLPYFPLMMGMLSGRFTRGGALPEGTRLAKAATERKEQVFTERNFDVVEGLTAFAEARGHTTLELAFARLIAEPAIPSVIAGATSTEQIAANAKAGTWKLSAAEIAEIDTIAPVE